MMELRRYTDDDYAECCRWWKAHKWPPMPKQFLPPVGFIVPGKAVGFLYEIKDVNVGMPEFIVSCPENTIQESGTSIRMVMGALVNHAREIGLVGLQAFIKTRGLQSVYEEVGFQLGDDMKEAVLYIRR